MSEFEVYKNKVSKTNQHKAKLCVWSDLSVTNADLLKDSRTPFQTRLVLGKLFNLDASGSEQDLILLDLYYYTVQFAIDNHFDAAQLSACFSIVKKVHEVATETPFDNVDVAFDYFQELLLCHSVHRPPFSLEIFNAQESELLGTYVLDTYFRHYKLYKFAFTPQLSLDLKIDYIDEIEQLKRNSKSEMMEADELKEFEAQIRAEDERQSEAEDVEHLEMETVNEDSRLSEDINVSVQQDEADSEELKQLREIVKNHLTEELKRLKISINDRIVSAEKKLNEKIEAVESSYTAGTKKSPKTSAKARK